MQETKETWVHITTKEELDALYRNIQTAQSDEKELSEDA